MMIDMFTLSVLQCIYSISECPISHPSQLTNPFLGLPLESGKCESCGTAEHGKCEGSHILATTSCIICGVTRNKRFLSSLA